MPTEGELTYDDLVVRSLRVNIAYKVLIQVDQWPSRLFPGTTPGRMTPWEEDDEIYQRALRSLPDQMPSARR